MAGARPGGAPGGGHPGHRRAARSGARLHRSDGRTGRPFGGGLLRRPGDRRPGGGGPSGHRRREARVLRETHGPDLRVLVGAGQTRLGRGGQARSGAGQAVPPGPAEAEAARRGRFLRRGPLRARRVRLLGLRRRLAAGATPLVELPGAGRRGHRRRHVPALGVPAARAVRPDPHGAGAHPHPHRPPLGRGRQTVRGHGGRRRVRHLRAGGRGRRPDQLLLGRPGPPRRAGGVPGGRDARIGGGGAARLPGPAPGLDPETGVESGSLADRAVPGPVAGSAGQQSGGQRLQGPVGALPAPRRAGRTLAVGPAGGRAGVQLARLGLRSSAEGRRLPVPEVVL